MNEIHPTASIHPSAVIKDGVKVGAHSIVEAEVEIEEGSEIGDHVLIGRWTRIGKACQVFHGAVIGTPPQHLSYAGECSRVELGNQVVLREYVTIHRASQPGGVTSIGDGCYLMAFSHVGHDCRLGRGVILTNLATLAGFVEVGDFAVIGGLAAIHQKLKIGEIAMIGGTSGVTHHIPPYATAMGYPPARILKVNRRGLLNHQVPPEIIQQIEDCYRILRRSLSREKAIEQIRQEIPHSTYVESLVKFIKENEPIARFG